MKKIVNLAEKIKVSLLELSESLESKIRQNDSLLLSNEELKKENIILRSECKNALFEVEKCLITIESIKANVNNNN